LAFSIVSTKESRMGEIAIHFLGIEQIFSAPLSETLTLHTVTPQAAAPAASCIPAPALIDPFVGKPPAVTSLTLAWKSDYALQPGEMFVRAGFAERVRRSQTPFCFPKRIAV
jgi:hypothetical protein